MEKLDDVIFYTLEKAVKSYRQFAQRNTLNTGIDVTIDQWLVLKSLQENTALTQQQLSKKIFKDVASVTRIIELLLKKGYLLRDFHETDRRRFELTITKEGLRALKIMQPLSASNRQKALKGITTKEIESLNEVLSKIISNVS